MLQPPSKKSMGSGMKALATVTSIGQFTFHYGYVPFILYLGFRRGADPGTPPLTLMNLLWQ